MTELEFIVYNYYCSREKFLENVKSFGVDEFKTKFKNRKTHDDLVHLAHID